MRIGLDVAQHQLLWPELAERVRFAESAGFDGAWVFDHFKPLYGDPSGPCLEAWTLLAGLAAVTSRIRLGALVTGITYRHPSILATEAITWTTSRTGGSRSVWALPGTNPSMRSWESHSRRSRSGPSAWRKACRSCGS